MLSASQPPDSQGATSATGFRHKEPGECLSPTFSCRITHFSPVTHPRFSRSSIGICLRIGCFSFTDALSETLSLPFFLCPATGYSPLPYPAAPLRAHGAPRRGSYSSLPEPRTSRVHAPAADSGDPLGIGAARFRDASSATGFRHKEPGECISPTFSCRNVHKSTVTHPRFSRSSIGICLRNSCFLGTEWLSRRRFRRHSGPSRSASPVLPLSIRYPLPSFATLSRLSASKEGSFDSAWVLLAPASPSHPFFAAQRAARRPTLSAPHSSESAAVLELLPAAGRCDGRTSCTRHTHRCGDYPNLLTVGPGPERALDRHKTNMFQEQRSGL